MKATSPSLFSSLWRYIARYTLWVVLSLLSIVAFAATTAIIVSLIEPLFSEVLPGGEEALDAMPLVREGLNAVGGGSPGAGGGGSPGAGGGDSSQAEAAAAVDPVDPGPLDWLDLSGFLRRLYEGLKSVMGVDSDEVIYFVPALFFVVYLIRMVAQFLSRYAFQRAGLGITTDMRNDLCERIMRQSAKFHGEHASGELFARVISDVDRIQAAVGDRLVDLFMQPLTLVALLILLLSTQFKLALVSLVAFPLILWPIVRFGQSMRRKSHRSQERMADLSSLLTEIVRGNQVVKAFGMEDFEIDRFKKATHRHLKVMLRAQMLVSYSSPIVETMAALGGCALMIYCGFLIRAGELTTALFTQFLANLIMLYDPIRRLNKVNLVMQGALAAARRVFDLIAIPIDVVDPENPKPVSGIRDSLTFDRVSFGYGKGLVLKEFSVEIRRGECVALVGRSGAGKSTVANLVPRFFDPEAGAVRIDGTDIREVAIADLRALIGLVPQDTVLFNDTVLANLAYGQSSTPIEKVRQAAVAAYADDFIMELPFGYDTVIGESGKSLSGGQRQRLAIARALLKDAPILILDEATSQLDTESEASIQLALENLMEGRTTLIIAHRLSTVMSADRIVVMDRGEIIEQGRHHDLLESNGAYRRLYDMQFND